MALTLKQLKPLLLNFDTGLHSKYGRFFISTVTVPFVLAVPFISSKTGTGDFPVRSSLSEAVPWKRNGQ